MKRLTTVPAGDDGPPPGQERLGILAVLATTLIGALAITGDIDAAVAALTALVAALAASVGLGR